jgi:hypothetical protein
MLLTGIVVDSRQRVGMKSPSKTNIEIIQAERSARTRDSSEGESRKEKTGRYGQTSYLSSDRQYWWWWCTSGSTSTRQKEHAHWSA